MTLKQICFSILCLLPSGFLSGQTLLPDDLNPVVRGGVGAVAVQADGKFVAAGYFTTQGEETFKVMSRLNADGSLDRAFNPAVTGSVTCLGVQGDGKILIGGAFAAVGGQPRTNIARLNADGAVDTGFNAGMGGHYTDEWFPPYVLTLAVQPDGKTLMGGTFTNVGGRTRMNVARVGGDGTIDVDFNPGVGNSYSRVYSSALQTDGKILVGGQFTTVGGQPRTNIARLNADGTLDASFNPGATGPGFSRVISLLVQPDGKILVGGNFTTVGGQPRTNIARLNADGNLDGGFNPGAGDEVYALALQVDGKLLAGGTFTNLAGQPRGYIGRLNVDGTLDSGFNPGANDYVGSVALQADGKIIVVGSFTNLGGQPRNGFGRLNNTEAATQSLSYDGLTVTWQRGGTSPEVWRTTFEHANNGSGWALLGAGTRIPTGWQLTGCALPPGATIRALGYVSVSLGESSCWFVETIIGTPVLLSVPSGRTNCTGTTAFFSVMARGTEPLGFQWRKDGEVLIDGPRIAGATSAFLSVSNIHKGDSGDFSVVVSNSYGSVTSSVARLTVTCSLAVNVSGAGSVSWLPNQTSFPPDSIVTLTANAGVNNQFAYWSGDATGTNNPLMLTMDWNKSVTAVFLPTYTLTVRTNGNGTVAVTPFKQRYMQGESAQLTAIPARWHRFTGWTDGNTTNPRLITVLSNSVLTASFAPTQALETVQIGGVARLAPVGMPAILVDGVFILADSAQARSSAEITILSTFTNGIILYTLDGSDPSGVGLFYADPFTLTQTRLLRAVAYPADLSRSVPSDPLMVEILPTITVETDGGGSVTVDPPTGAYFSNSMAVVTATAAPGWTFLHWLGDAEGTNSMVNVYMTRHRLLKAVFGTATTTNIVGGGTVRLNPAATFYPYGTEIRATGLPQAGNYLAQWSGSLSGTNNPVWLTVTNPNPVIGAVFASLGGVQKCALTVLVDGFGEVTQTPQANRYPQGANVVLVALPAADQSFLGWNGDATGNDNPLMVTLPTSKVVTASFTKWPRLVVHPALDGFSDLGFRMTLQGEWGIPHRIDISTNLVQWVPSGWITNAFGAEQFTDSAATNGCWRAYRGVLPSP